jgi:hypothetical protein
MLSAGVTKEVRLRRFKVDKIETKKWNGPRDLRRGLFSV